MNTPNQRRTVRWSRVSLAVASAGLLGLGGCDQLLEVSLPGQIQEEELALPSNAGAMVTSLVGAFECAYTNYVHLSAHVSDEMMVAGSFSAFFPYDQRDVHPDYGTYAEAGCSSEGGLYTPMSMARWLADEALLRLEGFSDAEVPNRKALMATAAAYAGYSYLIFGEGFCQAAFDSGPALSPPQVLALAEDRFTRAIQLAEEADNLDMLNMARIGRARARLDLGNKPGAAMDARSVPAGYVKVANRSEVTATRENKIYVLSHLDGRSSVDPAFWDLTWKGTPDPRVAVIDAKKKGNDSLTPLWLQTKYTSRSAPVPIASWKEARLILAEAEGGQTAVDIINELHDAAGIPPYDPATDGPIEEQIILERSRELFLEGHRLNDMLRFQLPFPEGEQPWTGRPYRNTTCFPLPNVEIQNNPNIES